MLDEKDLEILKAMEKRILEQSAANMRVILGGYVEPKFDQFKEKVDTIAEKMVSME